MSQSWLKNFINALLAFPSSAGAVIFIFIHSRPCASLMMPPQELVDDLGITLTESISPSDVIVQ
ncbi:MAG: hypothetical protein K0R63_278 [Rickettsiales bacterium]|nr:hypothetical protein [Rickettsiales bacterium]